MANHLSLSTAESVFDPEIRNTIRKNPRQYAIDNGIITADSDAEIILVSNPSDKMYLPVTHVDGAASVSSSDLQSIQAAGTKGTIGTAGSGGTASTLTSSVSSASSASTVGSAGSA